MLNGTGVNWVILQDVLRLLSEGFIVPKHFKIVVFPLAIKLSRQISQGFGSVRVYTVRGFIVFPVIFQRFILKITVKARRQGRLCYDTGLFVASCMCLCDKIILKVIIFQPEPRLL